MQWQCKWIKNVNEAFKSWSSAHRYLEFGNCLDNSINVRGFSAIQNFIFSIHVTESNGKGWTGARFTNTKNLLSHLLTGALLMKNSTSRENCHSRAWWVFVVVVKMFGCQCKSVI